VYNPQNDAVGNHVDYATPFITRTNRHQAFFGAGKARWLPISRGGSYEKARTKNCPLLQFATGYPRQHFRW
jgi:hypothetical protein